MQGMGYSNAGGRLFANRIKAHVVARCILPLLCITSWANAASFDCLIEPAQTIELASPVSGLLENVSASRGDRISKGQVLVQLESSVEKSAVELALLKSTQTGSLKLSEAKADFSRRKFERRRDMVAERLMSTQERDDAEVEFRLAEAEALIAKENIRLAEAEHRQQSSQLKLRTLRSPFDGVVVEQIAYPGEVVEPSGAKKGILKLAQLDPLRVHVILPKEAFGRVTPTMSADIVPEIASRGKHQAKVKTIDRLVDAASGAFVVILEMPNPKFAIPAGVKCKASFAGLDANSSRDPAAIKKPLNQ